MKHYRTYSYDIFDTCLVRLCGEPANLFDLLAYEAFQGEVSTEVRMEFVAARRQCEKATLQATYESLSFEHPQLKSRDELMQIEMDCERRVLKPVVSMRDEVQRRRATGAHIVFISDMYLPSSFLHEVLTETGFFAEGDTLYVSGDCGCSKQNGALFRLVHEHEHLSYRHWHHTGDNPQADGRAPRHLGIRTRLLSHPYAPYEEHWRNHFFSLQRDIAGTMAGLSRALRLSDPSWTKADTIIGGG